MFEHPEALREHVYKYHVGERIVVRAQTLIQALEIDTSHFSNMIPHDETYRQLQVILLDKEGFLNNKQKIDIAIAVLKITPCVEAEEILNEFLKRN